jgi:gas vesicle protein
LATASSNSRCHRPGRKLPRDPTELTNRKLNEDAKVLIIRLLALIEDRYGSVVELIRHAMTQTDRPYWAVGSLDDAKCVRAAKSAASKILGRSATQVPDWGTVQWIANHCADPGEREALVADLAGRWYQAMGEQWPPGYTGTLSMGEIEQTIVDPEQAPDDATKARMYREKVEQLEAELRKQDQRNLMLAESLGIVGNHVKKLEGELGAWHARWTESAQDEAVTLMQRVEELTRRAERAERKARRSSERVQLLSHYLAVLVAHLTLNQDSISHADIREVLPMAGIEPNHELMEMLTPPVNPSANRLTQWLAVYLRTLVFVQQRLVSRKHVRDQVEARILDLVWDGRLPDRGTIRDLTSEHPLQRAFVLKLLEQITNDMGAADASSVLLWAVPTDDTTEPNRRAKRKSRRNDNPARAGRWAWWRAK